MLLFRGGGEMCGRSRKTWGECVKDDMKLLGLQPEWAIFKDMWRDFIHWANIGLYSTHPPHHHTLCSVQAMQIFCLHY